MLRLRLIVPLTQEEVDWICSTLRDKVCDAKWNSTFAPEVEQEWWKGHSVWIESIHNKIVENIKKED